MKKKRKQKPNIDQGLDDPGDRILGLMGLFMSDDEDRTSTGVPFSEVPEFAKHHVEWIDGRHGPSQRLLPSLDEVPVPDILNRATVSPRAAAAWLQGDD